MEEVVEILQTTMVTFTYEPSHPVKRVQISSEKFKTIDMKKTKNGSFEHKQELKPGVYQFKYCELDDTKEENKNNVIKLVQESEDNRGPDQKEESKDNRGPNKNVIKVQESEDSRGPNRKK